MSLRLIVSILMLLTAIALGSIAYQLALPNTQAVRMAAVQDIPPPLQVGYFVAAHPLTAGTLIRDNDLTLKSAVPARVPAGAITDLPENRGSLRGALIRQFLDAGALITSADLLRPRDRGFLAAVLEPETRAVSVGVDAVTGVSGLIWPGDRVDVILTQDIDAASAPISRRVISETVLSNVRVIAVDQDIVRGSPPEAAASHVARTVALQVLSDQAERVAIAQQLGHLSLAIRAIDESTAPNTVRRSLYSGDVSPALSRNAEPVGVTVHVVEADKRSEVTFK